MGGWHKEERKSSAKAESGEEKSGRKMSRARVARSTPVGGNREIYASYEVFCSEKERGISSAFQKTRPPSCAEVGLNLFGRSETR